MKNGENYLIGCRYVKRKDKRKEILISSSYKTVGLHGGLVVSTVASWVRIQVLIKRVLGSLLSFYVPPVSAWCVLRFPPTIKTCMLGTLGQVGSV